MINDSLLSKFALISLNLPSLHTMFIAWGTVKGHDHTVESNVKALWIFGRFIRYIFENLDETCCTLLGEIDGNS